MYECFTGQLVTALLLHFFARPVCIWGVRGLRSAIGRKQRQVFEQSLFPLRVDFCLLHRTTPTSAIWRVAEVCRVAQKGLSSTPSGPSPVAISWVAFPQRSRGGNHESSGFRPAIGQPCGVRRSDPPCAKPLVYALQTPDKSKDWGSIGLGLTLCASHQGTPATGSGSQLPTNREQSHQPSRKALAPGGLGFIVISDRSTVIAGSPSQGTLLI